MRGDFTKIFVLWCNPAGQGFLFWHSRIRDVNEGEKKKKEIN